MKAAEQNARVRPHHQHPVHPVARPATTDAAPQSRPWHAFTESIAKSPARARPTSHLCRQAARQVAAARSVAAVAAELGVSWPVAHRGYVSHADMVLTEPEPPAMLGIDEARRSTPKWTPDPATDLWARAERFETNFTDLPGKARCSARSPDRHGRHRVAGRPRPGLQAPGRLRSNRPVAPSPGT